MLTGALLMAGPGAHMSATIRRCRGTSRTRRDQRPGPLYFIIRYDGTSRVGQCVFNDEPRDGGSQATRLRAG